MCILKRFIYLLLLIAIASCSKKHIPAKTPTEITEIKVIDSAKTVTVRKKAKANFPKIITVNDAAAKMSTDGRLYYDVMGHRYWKNYKDGKYYLFNKSMYNSPDFKAR
jgi:hypothetical protein